MLRIAIYDEEKQLNQAAALLDANLWSHPGLHGPVGRCMHYNCIDGGIDSRTIRVSFREAAASLQAKRRFCLRTASFVLNFQHATGVQGQTALLDNGQTMTLPRTAAVEFKKAWENYWLEDNFQ